MKSPSELDAWRPTFDTAGNQKVPLKKDKEGKDVPQTRGAAESDPAPRKEQR